MMVSNSSHDAMQACIVLIDPALAEGSRRLWPGDPWVSRSIQSEEEVRRSDHSVGFITAARSWQMASFSSHR